jgi:hypothetical protein
MRTSIVVLASVLTAATARAEKLGIVVTGDPSLQPQLTAQLERWLHDRGRTLVPGALEPDAINTLLDCFVLEDLGCARGVVETRARSRALLFARVEQSSNRDGTRNVSVTGYWFQKHSEPIAERRICTSCTDSKLYETVDELMLVLAHDPPPGIAGATPQAVAPEASAQPAPRGQPDAPPSAGERSSSRRMLPYGLIGAGALGVVGGLVMIGIDEDPTPHGDQRPTYRDTATPGAVLAIAGAAAVGAGVYLWLTDRRGAHPVAAVSSDGAVVGWAGRF